MECKGSGFKSPQLHWIMKGFYETKELITSQGLIAVLAIVQVRIVATNLGPEDYGMWYLPRNNCIMFQNIKFKNSDLVLINSKYKQRIY